MTPVRSLRRRPAAPRGPWAALLVTGSLLGLTGCSTGAGATTDVGAATTGVGAATRPAAKETCSDVAWDPPPGRGIVRTSRELVGFSPTVLGVTTTWAGEGLTAETVAGGYVDDLTETYDDLHLTRSLTLASGAEAEVLHGRLLAASVIAVVWREPYEDVPCDVHALVLTGANIFPLEEELLRGLG